jgi:hypothetical protein
MNMNAIAMTLKNKKRKANLPAKPFKKMTLTQKKSLLKIGAETFAKEYSQVLKKLANE